MAAAENNQILSVAVQLTLSATMLLGIWLRFHHKH